MTANFEQGLSYERKINRDAEEPAAYCGLLSSGVCRFSASAHVRGDHAAGGRDPLWNQRRTERIANAVSIFHSAANVARSLLVPGIRHSATRWSAAAVAGECAEQRVLACS